MAPKLAGTFTAITTTAAASTTHCHYCNATFAFITTDFNPYRIAIRTIIANNDTI